MDGCKNEAIHTIPDDLVVDKSLNGEINELVLSEYNSHSDMGL